MLYPNPFSGPPMNPAAEPLPARAADRVLHALKQSGPQPAAGLAGRLGVTPVAVRQHLDRLAEEGLVAFEDRREGVGRPRRYWRVEDAAQGRFPERHERLALELLAGIRSVFGSHGLDEILRHRADLAVDRYRAELAGLASLAERVGGLARLRAAEGRMAEARPDGQGGFLLVENHDPIPAAVQACPALGQPEHRLLARALGPDVQVECIEHVATGGRRCVYRIAPAA